MLHVPSSHFGLWTTTPEQIDPSGASNSTAGVMIQDKTRCGLPGGNLTLGIKHWLLYLHECKPPWREQALISRYRTSRDQQHPQVTLRTLRHGTEEHITRITVQNARCLLRVVTKIAP